MGEEKGFLGCSECKRYFSSSKCLDGVDVWGDGQALRLENNPAVWGSSYPSLYLLGFSKGQTQNQELLKVKSGLSRFEDIPFKGMRDRLQLLFEALEVVKCKEVDRLFQPSEPDIQSASLIRCSVSARTTCGKYSYKMKDILAGDPELLENIAKNCMRKHLADARHNSIFILLGLNDAYIKLCKKVAAQVFGAVLPLQETTYRTQRAWFVHVAHPSSNQTDPQYKRWVAGQTKKPKVVWAREAIREARTIDG